MKVRLAFAVAAFLEPDILVVDEVLAVGDAEFQKKAIGKMKDISNSEGRTVLFVSHNMAAIQDLCSKLLVVSQGKTVFEGDVSEGITYYLRNTGDVQSYKKFPEKISKSYVDSFEIQSINSHIKSGETFKFKIDIKVKEKLFNPIVSVRVTDLNNVNIVCWRSNNYIESPLIGHNNKDFSVVISVDDLYLLNGLYAVSLGFADGKETLQVEEKFMAFEIFPSKPSEEYYNITKENSTNSLIYSKVKWQLNEG
jgi:lipopolysaccharide transport system ATP-binding protein